MLVSVRFLKLRSFPLQSVRTEMGRRSRAFVNDNYNQVLIEDKENVKEFAMDEEKVGNFSCRVFLKKIDNQDDCVNVSKTLRRAPLTTNPLMSESALNVKHELKKQDSSELKKDESEFHDPRITKEAVVVLERHNDILKETTMSNNNSNVMEKDLGKDKHALYKSEINKPECECHSSLLLKDLFIVLERLDDVQEKTLSSDGGKAKKVANKSGKGTKRKKEEKNKEDGDSSKKSKKQKESGESKNSKKEKIPDVSAIDFSNESKSSNGNPWNFKISSWNVNGIRAWLEKNGISYLHHEKPDVLCIQETKCSDDKLPEEVKTIEGYHAYWLSGDKDGYSGVGLLTKEKPLKVEYGIGISEHDNEGRVITAEYDKFYLVSTYVPNAGRGLVRLDYRMKWDKDFREYLKKLDAEKPVVLTGDLNVAHEEIDLANPKTNKKNAGFTKEECEGFSALLKEGFIDTFRHLYPDVKGAYTFWTYMMNARAKNVGWRLDYFVISERFAENLCDSVIRKDVFGSDHCPVTLFLSL